MATKSILKHVIIKDKKLCHNLILALENAEKKQGKEVVLQRGLKTASKDDIIKIFGDKNDRLS